MVLDTEIWEKLDENKIPAFLEEVNPHLGHVTFNPANTNIKVTDLPFYDGYQFFQLTDFNTVPNVRKYVFYKPGDVVPVTWTNQPIYDLNERAPILIDETTVIEYAKFFFNYVRGRHGRFVIVESVDDLDWREAPPLQARKALQDMIAPVDIVSRTEDAFVMIANMVFKDSLFKTMITISKSGKVSLSNEEILVEGMPVLVDLL